MAVETPLPQPILWHRPGSGVHHQRATNTTFHLSPSEFLELLIELPSSASLLPIPPSAVEKEKGSMRVCS